MDRADFYDVVRRELFQGKLSQNQVDGMESILNFWESPPVAPTGEFKDDWDMRNIAWLAYILATAYHETAFTMQPIKEYGSDAHFTQLYWDNVNVRNQLGNTEPGDGVRFCGRGFLLLTGRSNYAKMTPIVQSFYPDCPDFTEQRDAVFELNYATVILFYGMICGTFTGHALKEHIGDPAKGEVVDFYNARKMASGLGKASEIQGYAKKFYSALDKSGAKP